MKTLLLVLLVGCLCLLAQAFPRSEPEPADGTHDLHDHGEHRGHSHDDHRHSGRGWNHDGQQGHESHNHRHHNHQPGHHHGGHETYHKRLMRTCAICVRNCRADSGQTFEECVAADSTACADVCYPAHSHRVGECLICIRQCADNLATSTNPDHQPFKATREKRITFCVKDLTSPCHRSCHHFDGEDN